MKNNEQLSQALSQFEQAFVTLFDSLTANADDVAPCEHAECHHECKHGNNDQSTRMTEDYEIIIDRLAYIENAVNTLLSLVNNINNNTRPIELAEAQLGHIENYSWDNELVCLIDSIVKRRCKKIEKKLMGEYLSSINLLKKYVDEWLSKSLSKTCECGDKKAATDHPEYTYTPAKKGNKKDGNNG